MKTMAPAWTPNWRNADAYMNERTGKYEWRAVRFRKAIDAMYELGLTNDDIVFDVGAGSTEFDITLRREYGFSGRYVPIDAMYDNTDLTTWRPVRNVDFFVALEIYEHLWNWKDLHYRMHTRTRKGIVMSTPNPLTTDVIGMDRTHVIEVQREQLEHIGYAVTDETFYGGAFSNGLPDSLFGVWRK